MTVQNNSLEGRNSASSFSNVGSPHTDRTNAPSLQTTAFNQSMNPASSLQFHRTSSQNLSGELVSQVKNHTPSNSRPASILAQYQASDFGRNDGTSFQRSVTSQLPSIHALANHFPLSATPKTSRFPEGISIVRAIDLREKKPTYNLALDTSRGQTANEQGRLVASQQQLNQWHKANAQFVKNNPNPMRDKFRNFVYQKEAGSNPNQLVYWRKDEGFPSLGIAHFTWKNSRSPFPRFLDYAIRHGVELPATLETARTSNKLNPWKDRKTFNATKNDTVRNEIKLFLNSTKDIQAQFAINEANRSLKALTITRDFNAGHKKYFNALRNHASGLLMLIDYHNFKGPGTAFGLKAVIRNMPEGLNVKNSKILLDGFVSGAHKAIANWTHQDGSPPTEKVKRGFRNRIESYRQFY